MSDRPKPKPVASKSPNDSRPNKKAWKSGTKGARKTRLSPLEKALMGGGLYRNVARPAKPRETAPQA